MRFIAEIAGTSLEIDLTDEGPVVQGNRVEAELRSVPGSPLRHLVLDGRSYAVLASAGTGRGNWTVSIDGRAFQVLVLDERTRAIRALGGAAAAAAPKAVIAPMPGLVLKVNVQVGQSVAAGQGLVVVEAMKMENELKAPADGSVSRIDVAPGDTVEKGAVLVVLE
jgi:acetyl/propionyl-CoA carboxylase alpha subunit